MCATGTFTRGAPWAVKIVEAVSGNPEAEEHARAYRNGMTAGFLSVVGGGASMVGGVVLLGAASQERTHDARSNESVAGGALVLGGLVAYAVGLGLLLNAQPRLYDAINAYNDGVPMLMYVPPGYPPGYPPPVYPPPGYPMPPPGWSPTMPRRARPRFVSPLVSPLVLPPRPLTNLAARSMAQWGA